MNLKHLNHLAGASLLLLLLPPLYVLHSATPAEAAESCHMRELDLCAATLVVFAQTGSGLATTEQDLNKQCGYLREADTCMRNFIKRCTTPIQSQFVAFMGDGSHDLLEDYCKPGSELRKQYLKHAKCLNTAQKSHHKSCIKDLQASFELLTSSDIESWQKRLPVGCCTYRRFEQCMSDEVAKKCGDKAVAFMNQILRRAFSRVPEMVCRNYKPKGDDCNAVMPAAGAQVKGSKSTSVISKLFSAYTGV